MWGGGLGVGDARQQGCGSGAVMLLNRDWCLSYHCLPNPPTTHLSYAARPLVAHSPFLISHSCSHPPHTLTMPPPSCRLLPTRCLGLEGVRASRVACGWRHSLVVDDQGRVFTFGWSKYGQLGHGDQE